MTEKEIIGQLLQIVLRSTMKVEGAAIPQVNALLEAAQRSVTPDASAAEKQRDVGGNPRNSTGADGTGTTAGGVGASD